MKSSEATFVSTGQELRLDGQRLKWNLVTHNLHLFDSFRIMLSCPGIVVGEKVMDLMEVMLCAVDFPTC